MLSKSSSNPEALIFFFFAAGINVFLVGKSMLIVMVPILINKDVFLPCYTDLKFGVQTTITIAPT